MRIPSKLLLAGLCSLLALPALAQDYPQRPPKIVVTSSPGAASDLLARATAERLQEVLKSPFIVEDRPGAGGNVAGSYVMQQKPDGYTLLLAPVSSHAINNALYAKPAYHPLRDFEPVIALASNANVLVVGGNSPINTVQELIQFAKAHPDQMTYSSGGSGTSQHLSAELFRSMAGLTMLHVPYKGSPEALLAVAKGEAVLMFANVPNALTLARSGKIKMLAVTSLKRVPDLPDTPTIAESGLPGFEAVAWFGLVAPAHTPADIVRTLNVAANKALKTPELQSFMKAQSFDAMGGSPEEFRSFMGAELVKWDKVVKASGAQVN